MKVLAIDVGLVNCSYCVLETSASCTPALHALHAQIASGAVSVERLELVKLGANKHAGAAATYDHILSFLRARLLMLTSITLIVIETQMTARMKAIAAAFYVATKCLCPHAAVLFQSASAKLNFADLANYCEAPAPLGTYAQRKRTAVLAAKKLMTACSHPDLQQAFLKAKKKDDLADALLHALAALCAHSRSAAPKAQGRRRPAQSMDSVGANT
jgi:hypothetical protein